MNPTVFERAGWSRKRLVSASLVVFVLQAGMVVWLGQRSVPLPERKAFPTAIYLAADGSAAARIEGDNSLEDPTLFALPSLNGFSGDAWLKFAPFDYQPPDSMEAPQFLEFEQRSLGITFAEFLRTNSPPPVSMADKPLPPLQRFEPNYPADPVPQGSALRFEGELAARPLMTPLKLKSWPHSEILSNTTVQAVVDASGFAVSKTLLIGSGKREADEYALGLVAEARWRPLPAPARYDETGDSLVWGKLVFQWHTLPLPAANLPFLPP
jgi:hypothetical protein